MRIRALQLPLLPQALESEFSGYLHVSVMRRELFHFVSLWIHGLLRAMLSLEGRNNVDARN